MLEIPELDLELSSRWIPGKRPANLGHRLWAAHTTRQRRRWAFRLEREFARMMILHAIHEEHQCMIEDLVKAEAPFTPYLTKFEDNKLAAMECPGGVI